MWRGRLQNGRDFCVPVCVCIRLPSEGEWVTLAFYLAFALPSCVLINKEAARGTSRRRSEKQHAPYEQAQGGDG